MILQDFRNELNSIDLEINRTIKDINTMDICGSKKIIYNNCSRENLLEHLRFYRKKRQDLLNYRPETK